MHERGYPMMMVTPSPPHPRIHRITVDERLDDDRVRLLITSLAPKPDMRPPYQEGEGFQDLYETWMPDEREVCISKSEFACLRTELAISSTKVTWKGLDEGCVYLAGEFAVATDRFVIARGQDQFEPIHHLDFVKVPARELYTSLLTAHDKSLPTAHDTSLQMAHAGGQP